MTVTDRRRFNGRTPRGLTPEQRFRRFVSEQPGGCWLWTGSLYREGYAAFQAASGRTIRGHQWAYLTFVGPVPDGMHLDHVCHSADLSCPGGACIHRRCVNPAHLEPVTVKENVRRGRGNGKETHCPQGHPYDEVNTYRDKQNRRKCRACMNGNRLRLGLMREDQHGTSTGYTYGCRCERCREAARVDRMRYRRKAAERAA